MRSAAAIRPEAPKPIALNLVLPYSRRVFGVDPIVAFLGEPLEDVLASVMRRPQPYLRRDERTGAVSEVFPLFLPDGEGASVDLGAVGELGFYNDHGVLVLTLPAILGRQAARQLKGSILDCPRKGIVKLRVEIRAGMRTSLSIGPLGELAIEVDQTECDGTLALRRPPAGGR